jgi:murein DD-endopeptidase MepM/ murein hydrolase activator NlpD
MRTNNPYRQPRVAERVLAWLLRHKRWLIGTAALPLFGVVAAFGTAPDTETRATPQEIVVETLALPQAVGTDSGSFDFWREERILQGDTLASLLHRLGVSADEIPAAVAAGRESGLFARLAAGRSVLARVTSGGRLLALRYTASEDRLASLERLGPDFRAREEQVKLESQTVLRAGEIRSSLYGATDAAGVPDSIASQMAEVFSGDIDFHRDLRQGDRFSVVYETFQHAGATVRTGRLLAAEFVNEGKPYRAVYFRDPQGREGYYTPEGRSMKRAFLKSPIPFSRVSSGFSSARYHPVLKEWRAHKGVDYAASTGTPIRAIADGRVAFSGRKGGYGNLVILDHQRPFSTAYGHMSRFAKGMRSGARVTQGEIIGYVGATGLASGPHLHFEFRVNGIQKNPLALKLPNSEPLDTRYRREFAQISAPLSAHLNRLANRNLAALD